MKESFHFTETKKPHIEVIEQAQTLGPERYRNLYDADGKRKSFEEVFRLITTNNALDELCIAGMYDGKIQSLATFNNIMSTLCLYLTDKEIDELSNAFIQKLKPSIAEYNRRRIEKLTKDGETTNRRKGEFSSQSLATGIKSAVHFLTHEKKPRSDQEVEKSIYYEPDLDVRYGIDYIEVVTDTQEKIALHLIQLKSSDPGPDEIVKTVEKHRAWTNHLIDLRTYEDSIMKTPEDVEIMQETLGTVEAIKERLLDMLTSDAPPDDTAIIENLIGEHPNAEKMWIISEYLDNLSEAVESLKEEGVSEDTYQKTKKTLARMRGQVYQALEKKRDLTGIQRVYSEFFVGTKKIHSTVIYDHGDTEGKAIKIKQNA
jgi:hypothetical protein